MQATEPVTAQSIETTQDDLCIMIRERVVRIPWEKCSKKLASATVQERLNAELSPGGYGIHWPLIDEDLSINSLLRENE